MNDADRYLKIVEWSDEDRCFIGSCPDLVIGGCHGNDPRVVFDELCRIVEESVAIYKPTVVLPNLMRGDLVNALQR
jgi:hypothetical protein